MMNEYNQSVVARSLDAIAGWTSPGGLPCLFLFISYGSNKLRRMTTRPNPGTERSIATAGWTVQSAFNDRNSHITSKGSPSPCREAAQSNKPDAVNPAMALWLTIEDHWRRVTDLERWAFVVKG